MRVNVQKITRDLDVKHVAQLSQTNTSAEDLLEVVNILNNITYTTTRGSSDSDANLYPGDLMVSVDVIERIASFVAMGIDNMDVDSLSKGFAESVSNCLDPATHSVWKNTNSEDLIAVSVTSMVNSTELLAFGIAKSEVVTEHSRQRRDLLNNVHEDIYSVTTANLDFEIVVMGTNGTQNGDVAIRTSFNYGDTSDSTIVLPLKQLKLRSVLETVEFIGLFAAKFPTIGDFFSLLNKTEEINDDEPQPRDSEGIRIHDYVNSDVMSAAVLTESDQTESQALHDPIVIVFKHTQDIGAKQPRCQFMNMQARTVIEQWDGDGCEVHSSNLTHTTCHCYHLTNFALIMDIHNVKDNLPPVHDKILSVMSYIGCSLSVLGCIVSICVFEFFRLKQDRIRIHENLAVSIALTQILFLVGIDRTENMYVCKVVAALLHYFLTALFLWMMIEGINMYVVLVKVFDRSNNIKKYLALGWGAPFIVVGVAVGVFHNDYGTGGTCWLPTKTLLVVFAPSAALIIFFNVFILIIVIRVMLNSMTARSKRQEDDLLPIKTGLKATLVLFPLLGLAWSFGFLSINTNTLIFTYAFVALNSLQVRKAFERRYGNPTTTRNSLQQLQNSSSSSSSSTPYTISLNVNKSATKNRWNVRLTKINVNSGFANLKDGFDNHVVLRDFAANERNSHENDDKYAMKEHRTEMVQKNTCSEDEINSRGGSDVMSKERVNRRTIQEVHSTATVLLRDKT
ncbi:adhesion G protein-coupled receptor L3-like [Glandiceps talaboti]